MHKVFGRQSRDVYLFQSNTPTLYRQLESIEIQIGKKVQVLGLWLEPATYGNTA
jgi:hypothetical protein